MPALAATRASLPISSRSSQVGGDGEHFDDRTDTWSSDHHVGGLASDPRSQVDDELHVLEGASDGDLPVGGPEGARVGARERTDHVTGRVQIRAPLLDQPSRQGCVRVRRTPTQVSHRTTKGITGQPPQEVVRIQVHAHTLASRPGCTGGEGGLATRLVA